MKLMCDRLDYEGRGICLNDGKITFVDGLLPGELADVKIILDKKKYAEGKVVKLIKRSSLRKEPLCKYHNCGCALNILSYEDQLKYKQNKIEDLVKRNKIETKVNKIIYDKNIYSYRNKISLKVKNNKVGYFHHKTNDFFSIDKCLLVSDKINNIINILNKSNLMKAKNIVIKEFNGLMIYADDNFDYSKVKNYVDSIYIKNKLVYGSKFLIADILNKKFYVSYESFFQVNKYLIQKLYSFVLENRYGHNYLDLYSGTGTIGILLSDYGNSTGIEINQDSVKCALENVKLNNSNAKFILEDANSFTKKNKDKFDMIVVDPPRSGIKNIDDLLRIGSKRIIYVSCNPITLMRNLNKLKDKYNIVSITPFDLFPQTYHVECVCILDRVYTL